MNTMTSTAIPATGNPWSLHPRAAWNALRKLLADPEQTEHVFTIVRALSGKTVLRGYNRFSGTSTGRAILSEKRNLIDILSNRDYLRALPSDSLGAHYLKFVEKENLSADGLVEASDTDEKYAESQITLYAERLRDMHDLWHVTTQHGRDVKGEVCLLAFTVAQTNNPGLALIAFAGMLKIGRESGDWRIAKAAWQGFRNGRRAAWLPAADWEKLLTMPLATVRQTLGVNPPTIYSELVTVSAAA